MTCQCPIAIVIPVLTLHLCSVSWQSSGSQLIGLVCSVHHAECTRLTAASHAGCNS